MLSTCPLAVLSVFRESVTGSQSSRLTKTLPQLFAIISASVKKYKTPQVEAVIAMDLFLTLSNNDRAKVCLLYFSFSVYLYLYIYLSLCWELLSRCFSHHHLLSLVLFFFSLFPSPLTFFFLLLHS